MRNNAHRKLQKSRGRCRFCLGSLVALIEGRADEKSGSVTPMKFLLYTLGDDSKPTPPPTPEKLAEIGKFMEEAFRAGVVIATGGLAPSATGTKVSLTDGKFTVVDGPFAEAKELVATGTRGLFTILIRPATRSLPLSLLRRDPRIRRRVSVQD